MDTKRLRAFLLTLPHVVETMQWGDNLVFWVGDKAIDGKMFCLLNLEADSRHQLCSYAAGPEHYADLLELEGFVPAPYFARIHWIAAERWDILTSAEWQRELTAAHALTLAKLPPRVLATLALSPTAQRRLIAEARRTLAAKAPSSKAARSKPQRAKPPVLPSPRISPRMTPDTHIPGTAPGRQAR